MEVVEDEGSGEHLKQLVQQYHSSYSYQHNSLLKGNQYTNFCDAHGVSAVATLGCNVYSNISL